MSTDFRGWRRRSPSRLSEELWVTTVSRVRGEFREMPGVRLTVQKARVLFGLDEPAITWVLRRLVSDGFLELTETGEFVRR